MRCVARCSLADNKRHHLSPGFRDQDNIKARKVELRRRSPSCRFQSAPSEKRTSRKCILFLDVTFPLIWIILRRWTWREERTTMSLNGKLTSPSSISLSGHCERNCGSWCDTYLKESSYWTDLLKPLSDHRPFGGTDRESRRSLGRSTSK